MNIFNLYNFAENGKSLTKKLTKVGARMDNSADAKQKNKFALHQFYCMCVAMEIWNGNEIYAYCGKPLSAMHATSMNQPFTLSAVMRSLWWLP